ncbi:MAG: hypothetical protein GY832_20900 [Chloroflexi bacterium]|nr:hypothetical protein [Chloroflexota bacterium]
MNQNRLGVFHLNEEQTLKVLVYSFETPPSDLHRKIVQSKINKMQGGGNK